MFLAGVDFENFTKISLQSSYLSKIRAVLAFKTLQTSLFPCLKLSLELNMRNQCKAKLHVDVK